ncbi:uncharacterized protein VP01_1562g4 [Puccinia sorghi]|uniref:Uncharacterized protein n=1 Tax=Puccinia sorghi TaxID=27349 RepID=A0A0L6VJU4_9BASI|nr:uncharacterized protein VP01_1562g4 [Puccinia sorghi]
METGKVMSKVMETSPPGSHPGPGYLTTRAGFQLFPLETSVTTSNHLKTMFSTQQPQDNSEASKQLRLLKRSIESSQEPLINASNQAHPNRRNKHIISSDPTHNKISNKLSAGRTSKPATSSNNHLHRVTYPLSSNPSLKPSSPPNKTESAIDVLRKLLQSRWDPVTKLLDLANLAQDNILKAGGIAAPGQKGAPLRTAGAIWKLCKEICPNVTYVLLVLMIKSNPDQFSHFRSNAEKEGAMSLQSYLFEIVRRFPSLEVLDGEAIDPAVKATIATTTTLNSTNGSTMLDDTTKPGSHSHTTVPQPPLPMDIKPAFFNDASTSSFVAAFCLQFFNAFDQDRASLMDVYATKSTFSLCASTYIPLRSKMAGLTRNSTDMPAQQVPSWNEYISISRNNARLKGPKLCERLAKGPAEIMELITRIPRTKHPLQTASDQHKFVVDSWQMPGLVDDSTSPAGAVIYLTIHGEFQEFPSLTVRSFDRTFLLGAAGPASAAALKGWPCVILTDQLTVRGYSSPVAWLPAPPGNTTANGMASLAVVVAPSSELTSEEKNVLVQRLMGMTKLNVQFSVDCLTQNHWDFDASLKNFHEIHGRGGLPPDAFLVS